MAWNKTRLVARLLWLAPLFLFFLALHQTWTAFDLRQTIRSGTRATAEVLALHQENRVDVTYDYLNLRVELPDGRVVEREKLSLPHTIVPLIEGRETLEVIVRPDNPQEMVIAETAATQWRIAVTNAAMSGVGALLFAAGVFAWNRYLRRRGDPARQPLRDDRLHPAEGGIRV